MFEGGGSIGRTTQVQRWDIIRHALITEFDASPDVFASVLRYSQDHLGRGNPPQNATEYFTILENNMLPEDLLDFLIVLIDQLCLHTDFGTVPVAGILRQYKEDLEEYRRAEIEDERSARNFVGRKEYIHDIRRILEEDSRIYKGVCICGMGGLGKTTLASHICRLMKRRWEIVIIELREVTKLRDLLREIFMKLECPGRIAEDESEILGQIQNFLEEEDRIKQPRILLLDNIDDVINEEGTVRFKEGFLSRFGEFLQEFGDECKLRMLLTSRIKISKFVKGTAGARKFTARQDSGIGVILEKELTGMNQEEANELFIKSIGTKHVDSSKVEKIVKLCGYSPLAITTLCSSIRYGLLNPYTIIEDLKTKSKVGSIEGTLAVTNCLEKTFDSLGEKEKRYLVRLSVFNTSSFDLEAAAAVLGERSELAKQTSLKLFNLKSRHFLEITDEYALIDRCRVQTRYSLHPLVFHLLKSKAQSGIFLQDMKIAKYNFVKHFRKVICIVAEEMEKHCIKGQRILSIDRAHVLHFYEILAGPDALETTDNLQTIMESRRISEIADELLYDETRWSLVNNFLAKTKDKKENQLEHIMWQIYQATMVMDMDRNQEASAILEQIEISLNEVRAQELPLAAVIGSFFYTKGRLCLREYQCEASVENLKHAANMFRIRGVKRNYQVYLAKTFNALGCSYFRQSESYIEKARLLHYRALRIITKTSKNWYNVEVPMYIQNVAMCLFKEGEAFRKEGKEEEAKAKYNEAVKHFTNGRSLNFRMNLHKQDGEAQILQNRGETYAALGNFEKAEKDVNDAMMLRRQLMSPPHLLLTLVTFKMAKVQYQKGVWLYHRNHRLDAINIMLRAKTRCDEVVDFITWGGLPVNHKDYPEVKDLIIKIHATLQEWRDLYKLLNKIQKFEDGFYQKDIKRRRSIKATTKPRLTQNELYALINSGRTTITPVTQGVDDSDDSDIGLPESSSSDDDDGDEKYLVVKERISANLFDEKQAAVDFTTILDGSFFKNNQNNPEENLPLPEEETTEDDSDMNILNMEEGVDEDDDSENASVPSSTKSTCMVDLIHDHQVDEDMEVDTENKAQTPQLTRQSSSLDMDVFGRPELVPQESVEIIEDLKNLQDNVLDSGAQRRQAWQGSSLESASLEYSVEKDGIISVSEQLKKVDISIEKRGNLLKLGAAETILEEDSDPEQNAGLETQTPELDQTKERRRRKAKITRQSSVSDDTHAPTSKRHLRI